MKHLRLAAALVVSVIATTALGYGSRAAYAPPHSDDVVLRLSWRWRGEKLESCRTRTEQELAALPAHMRTLQECRSKLLSYRLQVRVDDEVRTDIEIVPAGAKGDRPIFVLHDEVIRPGEHDIAVTFATIGGAQDVQPLTYTGRVRADAGRILLLTLSADATALELR